MIHAAAQRLTLVSIVIFSNFITERQRNWVLQFIVISNGYHLLSTTLILPSLFTKVT
jgi:hypothetical protein